jgi:hypothetical protein
MASEDGSAEAAGEEETSDSSYKPTPDSSQDEPPARSVGTAKRQHTITPMEGESIRAYMRAKTGHAPAAQETAPMVDEWQPQTEEELSLTRRRWRDLWDHQQSVWPSKAPVPFPMNNASKAIWSAAVKLAPETLMRTIHRFAFPGELLMTLHETLLTDWTAGWRRKCLQGSLIAYRSRNTDKRLNEWLASWIERISKSQHSASPQHYATKED